MAEQLLSVNDLTVTFGGLHAVEGCTFTIDESEVVALIGPNGAGKTTLLNAVSGFVSAKGSIRMNGRELIGSRPYARASLGIGRTFQNLQLFPDMTAAENVLTSLHTRIHSNVLLDVARFPVIAGERMARGRSLEILGALGLAPHANRPVRDLPFGVQKLVGVARALAFSPKILLLDEPAAGLNHPEAESLGNVILGLRRKFGVTILLVEHNMPLVMGISERVIVLVDGRKLTEGTPRDVSRDPRVIGAYLGQEAETLAGSHR